MGIVVVEVQVPSDAFLFLSLVNLVLVEEEDPYNAMYCGSFSS